MALPTAISTSRVSSCWWVWLTCRILRRRIALRHVSVWDSFRSKPPRRDLRRGGFYLEAAMIMPERNVKMFLIPRQHVGKLLHEGMSFRSNAYLPHDAVIETVSVDHQMDCLVI